MRIEGLIDIFAGFGIGFVLTVALADMSGNLDRDTEYRKAISKCELKHEHCKIIAIPEEVTK